MRVGNEKLIINLQWPYYMIGRMSHIVDIIILASLEAGVKESLL